MIDIWNALIQISTDPLSFFEFFGYLGLAAILFAETGLFGFFLPGDSLLFTLGLMSASDEIELQILIPTLMVATILGDHFSYFLGIRFSDWVKRNIHRIWLEDHHLEKAQIFYDSHGGKTILFCKFLPFIRTFAPFVAGIGKMNYLTFLIYNVVGGISWVAIFVFSGFYFGNIPLIKNNLMMIIILIVIISFIPAILEYIKHRRKIILKK